MSRFEVINPIGVELDETARLMRIRWDDGHLGEWRWTDLRRACPCALCAGEGNMPGVVSVETYFTPEQTTLERVKWIGRYALAPIWADGHDTGLFTYARLRELCQCPEHAGSGPDASPPLAR
jgi:DUF971 family protein